ncbi:hypothetical protein [Trichococcus paludicola]|nr:hypothetical protein [Trichococcus paludicola]
MQNSQHKLSVLPEQGTKNAEKPTNSSMEAVGLLERDNKSKPPVAT